MVFGLFAKKGQIDQSNDLFERIIRSLMALIPADQSLIYEAKLAEAKGLNKLAMRPALISVYFELTDFITSHQYPIVARTYTHEMLRTDIDRRFDIVHLDETYQIVFMSRSQQLIHIYKNAVNGMMSFIIGMQGTHQSEVLMADIIHNTIFARLRITADSVDYSMLDQDLAKLSPEELVRNFRMLYVGLYHKVSEVIGAKTANNIVVSTYNNLVGLYGIQFAACLLDIKPEGILDAERFAYLSKEELKRKIAEATHAEHEKREELEKMTIKLQQNVEQMQAQNELVQKAKEAVTKLLDESRELGEKLHREKNRLELIVGSMGEGLVVFDRNLQITMINNAACQLLRVSKEAAIGKRWAQIVTETDVHAAVIPEVDLTESRAMHSQQTIYITGDDQRYYRTITGIQFPIESTTTPVIEGNQLVGVVKVFKDVTKDVQSQQIIRDAVTLRTKQLQEEQARVVAAINSMVRGFILTDMSGRIIMTNHRLAEILQVEDRTWTMPDLQRVFGDSYSVQALIDKVHISGHKEVQTDILYNNTYLSAYCAPVHLGPNSALIGFVTTIDDVTEAKILERSKDEFFSIASHELRTPLTTIQGNASMIRDYYTGEIKNPDILEMIADIETSSVRLIGIVNDFLNTSRLEQRRMKFELSDFDIRVLCEEVEKEMAVMVRDKKNTLIVKSDVADSIMVHADRNKLKEVLMNLIGNSLKFTEHGAISLTIQKTLNQAVIYVADTGRGIPVQNQALLFRKFQQAGDSLYTRDTTKGTGLGLYISKLLMDGMGGAIKFEHSEPDHGTVFSISLPVSAVQNNHLTNENQTHTL